MWLVILRNLLLSFIINFIYLQVYVFLVIERDICTRAVGEIHENIITEIRGNTDQLESI